jgi:hypothetical protein
VLRRRKATTRRYSKVDTGGIDVVEDNIQDGIVGRGCFRLEALIVFTKLVDVGETKR